MARFRVRSLMAVVLFGFLTACGQGAETVAAKGPSLTMGSVEVDILGWTWAEEAPQGVRLDPEDRLVGVHYFAVNRGDAVYGLTMMSMKIRDGSGELHRLNTTATSLLGSGSLGEPLLPGEPHRGSLWFKVPKSSGKYTLVMHPGRNAEQSVSLGADPGVAELGEARAAILPPGNEGPASLEGWSLAVKSVRWIDAVGSNVPPAGQRGLAVTVVATNSGGAPDKFRMVTSARLKGAHGQVYGFVGEQGVSTAELMRRGVNAASPEVPAGASMELTLGYFVSDAGGPLFMMFDPDAQEPGKALISLPAPQ